MRNATCFVVVGLCLAGAACGDDDGTGVEDDAGATVDGSRSDAGADAGTTDTPAAVRFIDPDGAPLADVKFAVDTASGRVEGLSDAAGVVRLELPVVVGDVISWTAALERYVIVSQVDVPLGEMGVGEGAEPLEVTLTTIEPWLGERTRFVIEATDVPTGARLCASHSRAGGSNWSLCDEPGDTWAYDVPVAAIGETVSVWMVDGDDAAVDFEEVTIPEGETTVAVTFDGSFDTEPEARTVRIALGGATDSPLHTATLPGELWQGWFTVGVEGRQWSVATNPRRDAGDLLVDVAIMEPPDGSDPRYTVALYTHLSGFHSNSFATFVGDPGTDAQVMGLPTLMAGDRLDGSFTIEPPEPIGDDSLGYALRFVNSGNRGFWNVLTRSLDVTVPDLPSEYDRSVSFPFDGSVGTVVVQAATRLDEGEEAGVDRAFYTSFSEPNPVTF